MKKTLLLLFIGTALAGNAQSVEREVVSSGGDFYSNGTGQLSTTVGEPVIATAAGGGNELTQGFQQTNITITGIEDFKTDFEMNVFPNPTSDFVNITVENLKENLSFSIYTVEGKLVMTNKLIALSTKLDIATYVKGTYFLKVTDGTALMKTYKILKQ